MGPETQERLKRERSFSIRLITVIEMIKEALGDGTEQKMTKSWGNAFKNEPKTGNEVESNNRKKQGGASLTKTKMALYWSHGIEKLSRIPVKDNIVLGNWE